MLPFGFAGEEGGLPLLLSGSSVGEVEAVWAVLAGSGGVESSSAAFSASCFLSLANRFSRFFLFCLPLTGGMAVAGTFFSS
jgi:hypothetical protein